jgi:hypothetical protein
VSFDRMNSKGAKKTGGMKGMQSSVSSDLENGSLAMRRKDQAFVIYPQSTFVFVWEVLIMVGILYYNLAIPFRIIAQFHCGHEDIPAYLPGEGNSATDDPYSTDTLYDLQKIDAGTCLSQWHYSLIFDYLFDLVFLVDTVLRSRYLAFRRFEGEREILETDYGKIWEQYRFSLRFIVDIICFFPTDIAAIWCGYILLFRLSKTVSVLLLSSTGKSALAWLDKERNVTVSNDFLADAQLAAMTVLVAIWTSVGWCILDYSGDASYLTNSFYWCITSMTTTGYGDITPSNTVQTIYTVIVSLVGPSLLCTIIAKFASYFKKSDVTTDNVQHRRVVISQFLKMVQKIYFDTNGGLSTKSHVSPALKAAANASSSRPRRMPASTAHGGMGVPSKRRSLACAD